MNPWPFLRCTSCGHGQTFAGHLVKRGQGFGHCDNCNGHHKFKTMKTKILIIGAVMLAAVTNLTAQVTLPPEVKTNALEFVQGVSAEKNITVALYPSYAPNLINKDGISDQWGAGLALTYHPQGAVGQYTFAGLRLDYLGSSFWAPSVSGGLKADVQVFGFNITPLAYTGAVVPIGGAGKQNGDWGVIIGGGVKADLWHGKIAGLDAKLSVFAAAEKWTQFDGMIYHLGPALTIKW